MMHACEVLLKGKAAKQLDVRIHVKLTKSPIKEDGVVNV